MVNGTTGQTAEQIFAERVARIESNPLLVALSAITDLGTCGGRGGLQKALDIASDAIEADFTASKRVDPPAQPHCSHPVVRDGVCLSCGATL